MTSPILSAAILIESRTGLRPRVGIVLGSGLGGLASELTEAVEIPYSEIPNWPVSTALGHAGKLVLGTLPDGAGSMVPVAVLAGRAHLYEGYTAQQSAFGVRVLGKLGVKTVVLTNAAGGIGKHLYRGCLTLIRDHLNLQGSSPLSGPNDDSLGPRFPDMSQAYSLRCRAIAHAAAADLEIKLEEGVYAGLLGPSYETPAEIRFLRTIGADLVGMSTVAEAIAANHMGMEVLGISVVTNLAAGMTSEKLDHKEVIETGEHVRNVLVNLLKVLLPRLVQ